MLSVILLAGGSGTRFWPKSRKSLPKQLLRFGSEHSLLEEAFLRVREIAQADRIWVLTNATYVEAVREMLPEVAKDKVVGEPAARDTAAAVGLGALLARHQDSDSTVLVLPADQRIAPVQRFVAAARAADEMVAKHPDHIVVFGIKPREPATGYGYIERGEAIGTFEAHPGFRVQSFREKPDRATAERFVASGAFYWNAGMFCFRASTMLKRIEQNLPELRRELAGLEESLGTPSFEAELDRRYPGFHKDSIDFGVMERCEERLVVETDFEWDDVGSWPSLARHYSADETGNVNLGKVVQLSARDNIVDAGDGLVALLGVEGLVVVHTKDVTLVCKRDDAELVKKLLEQVDDEEYT